MQVFVSNISTVSHPNVQDFLLTQDIAIICLEEAQVRLCNSQLVVFDSSKTSSQLGCDGGIY